MARKRGGLAGIWDRNKKVIKPLATLAAGALTGGAGGALVGGLMNGLDREGKGGIGFDMGKGAVGAAAGYGMGKLGAGLKSGVMGRLGAGAANASAPAPMMMKPAISATQNVGGLGNVTLSTAPARDYIGEAAARAGGGLRSGIMSRLGGMDGKALAALGQTAVGGLNAYQQQQQMNLQREDMERRRRLEDEQRERQQSLDPVRGALMAQLLRRVGFSGGVS